MLAVGVVGDQALIPLELRPANVALVMVEDQSLPFTALLAESAHDPLAAILDRDAAAECVGPGVDRVRQHVVDRVVDGQLPLDAPAIRPMANRGQRQALLAKPEVHLPDRLHLGELTEYERDRLLDAPIRVLLDPVARRLHGTRDPGAGPAEIIVDDLNRALAKRLLPRRIAIPATTSRAFPKFSR